MPVNVKSEPPDCYNGNQQVRPEFPAVQSLPGVHVGRHSLPSARQVAPSHYPHQTAHRPPPPYPLAGQYRARPPGISSVSQPNTSISQLGQMPPKEKPPPPENTENQIDSQSAKGVFGWTTVDDISIPFLFRDEKKFVSVRMVEMKLLSKYPSSYPEELKDRPPLMSHYITANEAKLLNEINVDHCEYDYGWQPFTQSDLIVKLTDFEEFYNIVKKHFPEDVLNRLNKTTAEAQQQHRKVHGGWLQINNTVVPYILKNNAKLVPLSVIKYAAGLLTNIKLDGMKPTEEECSYLNEQCKKAGLNFFFGKATNLIPLNTVATKCKPAITELPKEDPFKYAQYKPSLEEDASVAVSLSMSIPNTVTQQSQNTNDRVVRENLGQRLRQPGPNAVLQQSQMNGFMPSRFPTERIPFGGSSGHQYWMGQHMGLFPQNVYSSNMASSSMQMQHGMQMPPPYTFPPSGPPPHNPNSMPYGGTAPFQNMSSNQSATDCMGPPNRTMTMDMNVQLHRARRASNESSGSGSSRPGSAVRASPSAALGADPTATNAMTQQLLLAPTPVSHQQQQLQNSSNMRAPLLAHQMAVSSAAGLRQQSEKQATSSVQQSQVVPQSPVSHKVMVTPPSIQPTLHHVNLGVQQQTLDTGLTDPSQNVAQRRLSSDPSQSASPSGRVSAAHTSQPVSPMIQNSVSPTAPQQHTKGFSVSPNDSGKTVSQLLREQRAVEGPQTSLSLRSLTGVNGVRGQSTSTSTPQSKYHTSPTSSIQPIEFQGKTISCMTKGTDNFALIEAIARVYFSHCSLKEFLHVLESVLLVPVSSLTSEEEAAFIAFYKLPTSALMCNKVIRLSDFENHLAQLRYMFKSKENFAGGGQAHGKPTEVGASTAAISCGSSSSSQQQVDLVSIPDNVRESPDTVEYAGERVANSSGIGVVAIPTNTPQLTLRGSRSVSPAGTAAQLTRTKRLSSDALPLTEQPPAKQHAGKLEDIMNRLKQKTTPSDETETNVMSDFDNIGADVVTIGKNNVLDDKTQVAPVIGNDSVICLD